MIYRNWSISQNPRLIIMVTVDVALALACVAFDEELPFAVQQTAFNDISGGLPSLTHRMPAFAGSRRRP
jgi:hypothetical protein